VTAPLIAAPVIPLLINEAHGFGIRAFGVPGI